MYLLINYFYVSVYASMYLCMHVCSCGYVYVLFVHLSTYLSMYLSVSAVYVSISVCLCFPFSFSVCVSFSAALYLSEKRSTHTGRQTTASHVAHVEIISRKIFKMEVNATDDVAIIFKLEIC